MAKSDTKKSKKSVQKKQEEKATKAVQEKKEESSSSESEASSSESESESSDSGSGSDDSDSESEDEKEEKKEEEKAESSDSDSDSDSEDEDEEKEEEKSKKRKADESSEEESSSSASPEPEAKKAKTESTSEPATLFVGRLSWNIDDDWLKREFEKYEGLIGARVISDRQSGRSKGFGYVDFESKEVAEKALAEMNGVEIDGRPINVDLSTAKPRQANDRSNERAKKFGDAKSEPSDTLFIGNLSFDSDKDSVTEFFAEYGPIMGVRLPTHPETEQLKGFGYVQFSSVDDAKKALDNLNGEYLNNRAVRLDFSTPKPQNNGGRGNFGGRGSFGGRGGRGGRDRQGGGFRNSGSGANSVPVNNFRGTKKTFD